MLLVILMPDARVNAWSFLCVGERFDTCCLFLETGARWELARRNEVIEYLWLVLCSRVGEDGVAHQVLLSYIEPL